MPSLKPVIALRLDADLYERVSAAAIADSRTVSNYVTHCLKQLHREAPSSAALSALATHRSEQEAEFKAWQGDLRTDLDSEGIVYGASAKEDIEIALRAADKARGYPTLSTTPPQQPKKRTTARKHK